MALSLQDSDFQSSGTSNQLPLTTKTLTVAVNDILVLKGACEDNATSHVLGSASSSAGATVTWTKQTENVTTLSNTYNVVWTGKVTAITTGTITASLAQSGVSQFHSMRVNQWRGGQLATTPATVNASGGSTPSATITATGSGNIIDWMVGDWAAVVNASPTGRTTSATPTFEIQEIKSTNYRVDFWHQIASGASSQTIGETLPTGQTSWIVGVEIQVAASGNASPTPATVAGTTTVPTPGMATGDTVTAVTVAGQASVPVPVMHTGDTVTASTVLGQASVPAPVTHTGSTVTATAVAGQASIPTPTTAGNVAVTAAVVTGQASVPSGSVSAGSGTTAYRIWPATNGPVSDAADYTDYSMGVECEFTTAGNITALYWWRASSTSPPPTQGGVYDVATGLIIGTAETLADPGVATGWIKWVLGTPIAVTTGVRYQPTVYAAVMGYSATPYYWDTDPAGPTDGPGVAGIRTGPIFAVSNSLATNGQSKFNNTNPIAYPNTTFHAQNYWVDVELTVASSGDAAVTTTTVAGATSIPTGTVATGDNVSATTVAGQASVPTPTVTVTGNASPHPTTVAGQASIPALTPSTGGTGASVTPTTVAGTTVFPTLTGTQGATATPATVAGTASVPTPSVSTTSTGSPHPTTVAGQASIPTPTIALGSAANPHATTVAGQASIPAPVVVVPISQTVTAVTVTGQASVGTASISVAHTGVWSIWDGVTEVTIVPDRYWTGGSLIGLIYSGLWDGSTLT